MDLFGKQARQELEQLQEKYTAISDELRESKALVAAINADNKSKAQHQSAKVGHDQKVDEYCKLFKETVAKEAELLALHEKKKSALTTEMGELEKKISATKVELSDVQKRFTSLEMEIQTSKRTRDSIAAEVERLKNERSASESALRESQEKQSSLAGAVAKLSMQQEALAGSNQHLFQLTSHLNRTGDEDTVFASLEHDLHRFLAHDRTSSAMQVELKARPLLLVVDFGYDGLNLAAVRAGLLSGSSDISLIFESRKIDRGFGSNWFDELLANWLWERFTTVHPSLKKSVKEQKGVELSLSVARRLLSLLCQGAPQGEVEETIIIDSEPFSAAIPLLREELISVFLPLLGLDGELTGAIRRFLAEFKFSVEAIDRVVCMGWYGRLPLVRESLGEVFKRPVLVAEQMRTVGMAESRVIPVQAQSKPVDRVSVVVSDTKREKREKVEKERVELERQVKLAKEQKEREKVSLIYTDRSTGLQWARNANIAEKSMIWEEANRWVANLEYDGHRDWRLPTKEELEFFAKKGGSSPAEYFNNNGFSNAQANGYWSSSTYAFIRDSDGAWGVGMTRGNVFNGYKDYHYYVWPVRSGQY